MNPLPADKKSFMGLVLKYVLAVGIIYYLVATKKIDPENLYGIISTQFGMITVVVLSLITAYLIGALRWYCLLRWQDIDVTFMAVVKISCIGYFFNSFMPGALGGDVVKAYYIAKNSEEKRTRAVLTAIIDRVVGLAGHMTVAFFSLLLNYRIVMNRPELKAVFLMILIFLAGALLVMFFSGPITRKANAIFQKRLDKIPFSGVISEILYAFNLYSDKKVKLLLTLGLTFIINLLIAFVIYMIGSVIPQSSLSFLSYLSAVPIGNLVISLPLAPAGIGLGQGIYYNLFVWFGNGSGDVGITIITIYQMIVIALNMLFGVVYLAERGNLSPGAFGGRTKSVNTSPLEEQS